MTPAALLAGADFTRNPYALYDGLRAQGDVHRVTLPGGVPAWLVTGYDACRAVLVDERFSKDMPGTWRAFQEGTVPLTGDVVIGMGDSMLVSDPPRHSRLRALVSRGFTTRRVRDLAPHIEATASRLVQQLPRDPTESFDLVTDFAALVPMQVICPLLGIAEEDGLELRLAIETVMSSDEASRDTALAAFEKVHRYLSDHVARRIVEPADDLTSALIDARDVDDRLDDAEVVSMLALLLSAGHETTVNLIASLSIALLRNASARETVRADPTRWDDAVEEALRYDGPIQNALWRFTRTDVIVGDVRIPAGEAVAVSLASANRDPAHVSCPHEFELDRSRHSHMAFGHGIHHCLGAGLARLEARIATQALFESRPTMRLLAEPEYRASTVSRAPGHVLVGL